MIVRRRWDWDCRGGHPSLDLFHSLGGRKKKRGQKRSSKDETRCDEPLPFLPVSLEPSRLEPSTLQRICPTISNKKTLDLSVIAVQLALPFTSQRRRGSRTHRINLSLASFSLTLNSSASLLALLTSSFSLPRSALALANSSLRIIEATTVSLDFVSEIPALMCETARRAVVSRS